MDAIIKHIPSDRYLVVSKGHLELKTTSQFENTDSTVFTVEYIYSSLEISTIHNNTVGYLIIENGGILSYGHDTSSSICLPNGHLTDMKGHPLTLSDGAIMQVSLIPYSTHMDRNFEYTEFQNGEVITLRVEDTDNYLYYFSGRTFMTTEGVRFEPMGHGGLADTNCFQIKGDPVAMYPVWTEPEPTIGIKFQHLAGGFLYFDSGQIKYTKDTTVTPNIEIRSVGFNQVMLFDAQTGRSISPKLIKMEPHSYRICEQMPEVSTYKGSIETEIESHVADLPEMTFEGQAMVTLSTQKGYLALPNTMVEFVSC